MTQIPGSVYRPGLAILTALPMEFAAVKALLDHPILHTETDHRGTRHYALGTMPGHLGCRHEIALTMVGVGNNISAVATTQLLNDLPSVHTVILSGIAGGVPNVGKAGDHVRLGDIVVSNDRGVIQYDFVKEETDRIEPRHPPRPASSNLFRAARVMEADALAGARPWDVYIEHALTSLKWKRPPNSTDILAASDDPSVIVKHPKDPLRIKWRPRVFVGPIASSNTLLKSPRRRDRLRDTFGVKAVEMEASGAADAAWMSQAQHFVVRGVCDYCDSRKSDDWQCYAAAAAAGYVAALLKTIDPIDWGSRPPAKVNIVRPDAARPRGRPTGTSGRDDDIVRRIDDTQARLMSMQAESGSDASLLLPTITWITSIDRKLHQNRILLREVQALEAIHDEVLRTSAPGIYPRGRTSPVERLSLNLLERYANSPALRGNWEVRCAIGNSLTFAMTAGSEGSTTNLVSEMMHMASEKENWDVGQMLFDALHHASRLSKGGRDFFLTAAGHEHHQVRWNVAAGLKSIALSTNDLRQVLGVLLRDPSPWVIKELIDVGLRSDTVMAGLEHPKNSAMLMELLDGHDRLAEHAILSLQSRGKHSFFSRFTDTKQGPAECDATVASDRQALKVDYRRVEELRASLKGQYGSLYKAAEQVIALRLADPDAEHQQRAIMGYLRSTHDALAWASVRALFGGKLDSCHDDFLTLALSEILTSRSEWIRRECVEETLRLEDGRRKYLALRQIEVHRNELAKLDEIRPYLVEIGMQFEG
jgi:nucleoside phosphorylase